jgi:hypothetical protein
MEILLIWLPFSVIVGAVASSRGRDGFGWFLLSVLISPILSVLALLCTTNLKTLAIQKAQHEELMRALGGPSVPPAPTSPSPVTIDAKARMTIEQARAQWSKA